MCLLNAERQKIETMANTYKKYCPNVYVAKCDAPHEKGETILVETKHGKENECIVFNLVHQTPDAFYYSIVRADGFNSQERAKNRAERLENASANATKKSNERWEAANEGRDFLVLAEPIKIGHHSEKRHRALIQRNHDRMNKAMQHQKAAESYADRVGYWADKADKIDLSMPESIEYFEFKVEQAKAEHQNLKDNPAQRSHSFALTYAKKAVNEAEKNLKTAIKLWG